MEMVLNYGLCEMTFEGMELLEGGCGLCTAGAVIGGAATGAGTVLALASNPAGWVIGAGALVGAGIGYLITL